MSQGEKQPAPVPPRGRVVIAGGSGTLGRALADDLDDLLGGGA